MKQQAKYCLFTFDVEEWFQVENMRGAVLRDEWPLMQSFVKENSRQIQEILEQNGIKGTFFILGWVAERFPELVKEIASGGHEIASHGTQHKLTHWLDEDDLAEDILRSRKLLEKAGGKKVHGYRAPSFSVSDRVVRMLRDAGFRYDASYFPFRLNNRYGSITELTEPIRLPVELADNFYEVPVSTVSFIRQDVPIGGGAYFRLMPYRAFRSLVKRKIKRDHFYAFYLHPWELEPGQPKIRSIKFNYQLRHYTGLKRTAKKLDKLIRDLKSYDCKFLTISEYLDHYTNSDKDK